MKTLKLFSLTKESFPQKERLVTGQVIHAVAPEVPSSEATPNLTLEALLSTKRSPSGMMIPPI
jgi:hypothetical protein